MQIKTDCRHYRGDLPCAPHKRYGAHCDDCSYYDPISRRILIIKLGAIGDVIRTTPLLTRLREVNPGSEITWVTHTPEILPSVVDRALRFDLKNAIALMADRFDLLLNLDKDAEACALASLVPAAEKRGFVLSRGRAAPIDDSAIHKWRTGLFDDVSLQNQKSYQEEAFEICGYVFRGEEYLLDPPTGPIPGPLPTGRPLIGLNTGCGKRWVSRMWPVDRWIELARGLGREGFGVVLLGGEEEDAQNRQIAEATGASYLGHFPLRRFLALVNQCQLVVTLVTMAMHLAIGLKKQVVLINNIFNPHEFELYGRGEILGPEQPCRCFYQATCTQPRHCMETLSVKRVMESCVVLLKPKEMK